MSVMRREISHGKNINFKRHWAKKLSKFLQELMANPAARKILIVNWKRFRMISSLIPKAHFGPH